MNTHSNTVTPAQVGERHLIDDKWIMRADDEALDNDCETWWRLDSHHSGRWMIGAPYNRNFFVPIRRAGPRPDPLYALTAEAARQQRGEQT